MHEVAEEDSWLQIDLQKLSYKLWYLKSKKKQNEGGGGPKLKELRKLIKNKERRRRGEIKGQSSMTIKECKEFNHVILHSAPYFSHA